MTLKFYKYQGTGNDFVMVDNRDKLLSNLSFELVKSICDRKFGIGADGMILLENEEGYDFKMVYFNSDGNESSMCGNGGRCIVQFAKDQGIIENSCTFLAIDGKHEARIEGDTVKLHMSDVEHVNEAGNDWFTDTGSPHHVVFATEVNDMNLVDEARAIRYSDHYKKEGVNVNFVRVDSGQLQMRTYERGVEDETLSCGTGVTAAAIVAHHSGRIGTDTINIETAGGQLNVSFQHHGNGYSDIWLSGPAKFVFSGTMDI